MPGNRAAFDAQLRAALNNLYSPSLLSANSLVEWLALKQERNSAAALQRVLLAAIESLRPQIDALYGSRAWRLYQILRRRYIEQLPQNQVARDLGLSTRQLQREEQVAREELAAHLWTIYRLDQQAEPIRISAEPNGGDGADPPPIPTRQQELEHLRQSAPATIIQPGELIAELVETVAPLAAAGQVAVVTALANPIPPIAVQTPLLRQALLDILSVAIQQGPGGVVQLQVTAEPEHLAIAIASSGGARQTARPASEPAEQLAMAAELVSLCNGEVEAQLNLEPPQHFQATVRLPTVEQATVLVIDDNVDTQQLLRRYLAGSRYCFTAAQDGHQGLALAQELAPRAIVLDVMMPTEDGWTVLSRLREHPQTRQIPVIVCTILAQEGLARVLGAAHFLRKPVGRAQLLNTLDQVTSGLTGSGAS
jgi:CheY-like chemotaxis protein